MAEQVGTTIIEPSSSRFTKVSTILDYKVEADVDGQVYSKNLPIQQLKRFPGSKQVLRPHFHGKSGKFRLVRADGTEWTQDDLNKLVKEVPINYEDYNAPNKSMIGTLIPSSNIKNGNDAYLASHQWKVKLEEGFRTLKDSTFLESVYADIMRGNPGVGIENEEGIQAGNIEYVVKRPELAKERSVKRRDQTITALDIYRSMQTDRVRLIGILRLFNIDIDSSTDIKDLQDAVWEKADDAVTTQGGNSYQKLFVYYGSLEPKDFRTKELISLGTNRGLIRPKGGMYYFDDVVVGSTTDDMLEYFNNNNNSARFDALKILLDEK